MLSYRWKAYESIFFYLYFSKIFLVFYNENKIGKKVFNKECQITLKSCKLLCLLYSKSLACWINFLHLKDTAPDIKRHKDGIMRSQSSKNILVGSEKYISDHIVRRSNKSMI